MTARAGSVEGWTLGLRLSPALVCGLPVFSEFAASLQTGRQTIVLADLAVHAGSVRLRLHCVVYWWIRRGAASAPDLDRWPVGGIRPAGPLDLVTLVQVATEHSLPHDELVRRLAHPAITGSAPVLQRDTSLSAELPGWSARATAGLLEWLRPLGLDACVVLSAAIGGAPLDAGDSAYYARTAGVDPNLHDVLRHLAALLGRFA